MTRGIRGFFFHTVLISLRDNRVIAWSIARSIVVAAGVSTVGQDLLGEIHLVGQAGFDPRKSTSIFHALLPEVSGACIYVP